MIYDYLRRQRIMDGTILIAILLSSRLVCAYNGNDECIEWVPSDEWMGREMTSSIANDVDVLDFTLCKTSHDEVGMFHDDTRTCLPFSSSMALSGNNTIVTNVDFKVAKLRPDTCMLFWKQISFDVNPLNSQALIVSQRRERATVRGSLDNVHDLSLCKSANGGGLESVGVMVLSEPLMGHCIVNRNGTLEDSSDSIVGGGYFGLSAWPLSVAPSTPSSLLVEEHQELYSQIEERINLYLTDQDRQLLSKITTYPFDDLMRRLADPTEMGTHTLRNVLSTTPFVPSRLNEYGLSLLRSLLSERMTNARRRHYNHHHHPDTDEWEANGVLLKDFDFFSDPSNIDEFRSLLAMCGAVPNASDIPDFEWSEVKVVSYGEDPQQQPHVDTFHSVVKMWVYERDVVTLDHGPLHFMRGTTRGSFVGYTMSHCHLLSRQSKSPVFDIREMQQWMVCQMFYGPCCHSINSKGH